MYNFFIIIFNLNHGRKKLTIIMLIMRIKLR